jgi:hypothetical protein
MTNLKRYSTTGNNRLQEDEHGLVVLHHDVDYVLKGKEGRIAALTSMLSTQVERTEDAKAKMFAAINDKIRCEHDLEKVNDSRLRYSLAAGVFLFIIVLQAVALIAFKYHIFK